MYPPNLGSPGMGQSFFGTPVGAQYCMRANSRAVDNMEHISSVGIGPKKLKSKFVGNAGGLSFPDAQGEERMGRLRGR